MRLVNNKYKNLPENYVFTNGENIIISEDVWCCYSSGVIELKENETFIQTDEGLKKISWHPSDAAWFAE